MSEIKKIQVPELATVRTVENIYVVNAPDGTPANTIEGVKLVGNNYPVMAQKNLHETGKKVVYIKWDACIPDIPLFESFHRPDGNPKKSLLAAHGRVRVVKLAGNYSYGIILPLAEVQQYFDITDDDFDVTEKLGLFKTETVNDNFLIKRDLPSFLYKTDEPNIYDTLNDVEVKEIVNKAYRMGMTVQFTTKRDGGSGTFYVNLGLKQEGIGTRTADMKLIYDVVNIPFELRLKMVEHKLGHSKLGKVLMKDATDLDLEDYLNDEKVWAKRPVEQKAKVEANYNLLQAIKMADSLDIKPEDFADSSKELLKQFPLKLKLEPPIEADKEHNYFQPFKEFCEKHELPLALRGEVLGYSKGSNNKRNPDKTNRKIVFFGLDVIDPLARRINTDSLEFNFKNKEGKYVPLNLYTVCEELGFEATPIVHEGIMNYEEVLEFANKYFESNLVEGLILRTKDEEDGFSVSCKIMNPKYDEK